MLMTNLNDLFNEWDESRIDIVGQNGNEGLHYEKNDELIVKKPKILVTGVTGYIGSQVSRVLFERGWDVIGLDINSHQNDISAYVSRFVHWDIRDAQFFEQYDAVVHLAGLISVEESMTNPTEYYSTNLLGTAQVLRQMDRNTHLIFASTAGAFDPQSPYARSKIAAEDIIKEQANNYTIFRFFNVAGSDGDNMQQGNATHLIRIAAECAVGTRDKMSIFGHDYDTGDGTCIRDYVHVVDLANAIANAIEKGPKNTPYECIGSGTGYTVKEVIRMMKRVSGVDFEVVDSPRRAGDPAVLIINNRFDGLEINYTLEDMCRSAWQVELKRGVL